MSATDLEQAVVAGDAPIDEQPEISRVTDQRVAGVPGEEPGDRAAFGGVQRFVDANELNGRGC